MRSLLAQLGVLKLHGESDLHGAIEACKEAIKADPLCETAHVHMAHLQLQNSDLRAAVAAFDDAVALLRVKQELEETFAMRRRRSASLLTENPAIYGPAMAKQREAAAMAMAQQQQECEWSPHALHEHKLGDAMKRVLLVAKGLGVVLLLGGVI